MMAFTQAVDYLCMHVCSLDLHVHYFTVSVIGLYMKPMEELLIGNNSYVHMEPLRKRCVLLASCLY